MKLNQFSILVLSLLVSVSSLAGISDTLFSMRISIDPFTSKAPTRKKTRRFASFDPNAPRFKKSKKAEDQLLAFLSDKGVNLDLNGNGKDDYWRTYKRGRIHKVKYDLNEDGKMDGYILMSKKGFRKKIKKDSNFDGSFDYQAKCTSSFDCVELYDFDDNGTWDRKIVKSLNQKYLQKNTYVKVGKIWRLATQTRSNLYQASEGGLGSCNGDCVQNKQSLLKLVSEISTEISEIEGSSELLEHDYEYFENDMQNYARLKSGVLIHESCKKGKSKSQMKNLYKNISKTVSAFVECSRRSINYLEENGFDESINNYMNNIFVPILNRLKTSNGDEGTKFICNTNAEPNGLVDDIFKGAVKSSNPLAFGYTLQMQNESGKESESFYVGFPAKRGYGQSFYNNNVDPQAASTFIHELVHGAGHSHGDGGVDYAYAVEQMMSSCMQDEPSEDLLIDDEEDVDTAAIIVASTPREINIATLMIPDANVAEYEGNTEFIRGYEGLIKVMENSSTFGDIEKKGYFLYSLSQILKNNELSSNKKIPKEKLDELIDGLLSGEVGFSSEADRSALYNYAILGKKDTQIKNIYAKTMAFMISGEKSIKKAENLQQDLKKVGMNSVTEDYLAYLEGYKNMVNSYSNASLSR